MEINITKETLNISKVVTEKKEIINTGGYDCTRFKT